MDFDAVDDLEIKSIKGQKNEENVKTNDLKSYEVTFLPSKMELEELIKWVSSENEADNDYYHFLPSLITHFDGKTLAIIKKHNDVVGYVCWTFSEAVAHITCLAIKASERKLGLGEVLTKSLFKTLTTHGILVVYLDAASSESEQFWAKMGGLKMPSIRGVSDKKHSSFYFTLVPTQEQGSEKAIGCIKITPNGANFPTVLPLSYHQESARLKKPIIIPTDGDWLISLRVTFKVIETTKIKNFYQGTYYFCPFLIIENLPENFPFYAVAND